MGTQETRRAWTKILAFLHLCI